MVGYRVNAAAHKTDVAFFNAGPGVRDSGTISDAKTRTCLLWLYLNSANMTQTRREAWLQSLRRLAKPVAHAARQSLTQDMPIRRRHGASQRPVQCAGLEAVGRSLCGIAPWLDADLDGAEETEQQQLAADARAAMLSLCSEDSADYADWSSANQFLVDAAFLAHAVLRAPVQLNQRFSSEERQRLVQALAATRSIKPGQNNWLLFSAMVECGIDALGGEAIMQPVHYALDMHQQWYVGDGTYGDGPHFHADYYNSFVIQPMQHDVCVYFADSDSRCAELVDTAKKHLQRYAAIQERMIAADGSFPVLGRSICYRCGAFQALAQAALQHQLPEKLAPAQVRCALSAVIKKTLDAPDTFDDDGWLQLGLCGHQPDLAEDYINTGSVYLAAAVLLPLGLPASDPFWADHDTPWTAQLVWSGADIMRDHAI